MKIFSNDRHRIAPNPMLEERGSKVNVSGLSCPDPLDRIKNDVAFAS
ncbi:MAG TPA: hypothetical protein VFZ33_20320 [Chitinophagaceae bacterium]